MDLHVIWFILWSTLWAAYFVLDGFDLGAGMLAAVLPRDEVDRKRMLRAIGPVWNGNEVWLVTAGGATFAAFPAVYAALFSYLYIPVLFILFGLILRGAALEFRDIVESAVWRRSWDAALFAGSLLPPLLFGIAFGNIFRGLPIDATGYHGSLQLLMNPYGLLAGTLLVILVLVQGSLYIAVRTDGRLSDRASRLAATLWMALIAAVFCFLAGTWLKTGLYAAYLRSPLLMPIPGIAICALIGTGAYLRSGRPGVAFACSCTTTFLLFAAAFAGLFPNLIPSSIDPAASLTVYNASSGAYTLSIMTVVAAVFLPVVIFYQVWAYRIFSSLVTVDDVSGKESYE